MQNIVIVMTARRDQTGDTIRITIPYNTAIAMLSGVKASAMKILIVRMPAMTDSNDKRLGASVFNVAALI
ncbi:hypothetical protein Q8A64_18530 [Oxalobacteraceae bacterium R-40]|uniref:Uncharacterized protein n=1 Tax=Keguizhuia sedimenti TaxID=3064264 RepID=A0ABU1BTU9_9BURK|nr:hypothetical protein [Oxalobacteraceae bacterium R-40]